MTKSIEKAEKKEQKAAAGSCSHFCIVFWLTTPYFKKKEMQKRAPELKRQSTSTAAAQKNIYFNIALYEP